MTDVPTAAGRVRRRYLAAVAILTLSGCDATGEVARFENCDMTLETLSEVQNGGLLFQVVGSRQMCIDPNATEQNPWPFAAALHVTNIGNAPVALSYSEGSIARHAFGMNQITEVLNQGTTTREIGSDDGPIDPDAATTVKVTLPPGGTRKVPGDARYILKPIQLTVAGENLSGLPVSDGDRMRRSFKLDFTYWVNANGTDITGHMLAPLTVFLKPS